MVGELGALTKIDSTGKVAELEQNQLILDMISNNLDEVFDLAFELCSIKERKDMDELDMDDGVELILAIIEVNKHFFMKKVLPLVQGMMGRST